MVSTMALENMNNLNVNTRLCAGVLAAYLQLARGTKYSQFPRWLDAWLRMRKHLGLLMLLSASIHVLFYLLLYSPGRGTVRLPGPDPNNNNTMAAVAGEQHSLALRTSVYLGAGVIGFTAALVLGIASLPSVSSSLSWREFR